MQNTSMLMPVKRKLNEMETNALKMVRKYCSTVHAAHYQTCFSLQGILQSPLSLPEDDKHRWLLGKCNCKSSVKDVDHENEDGSHRGQFQQQLKTSNKMITSMSINCRCSWQRIS